MTRYRRILSLSPSVTFGAAADGNFYPRILVSGLSRGVVIDHAPLEVGIQYRLYETCRMACSLVSMQFSDKEINQSILRLNERTERIKRNSLRLLAQNPRVAEAGPEWTVAYLSKMGAWEAVCLVSNWIELELPKDQMIDHFVALAIVFVDNALHFLRNRNPWSVECGLIARESLNHALHLSGRTFLGAPTASTKGGQSKQERSKRVGDFAFKLTQERSYRSKAEAVRQIKDRVLNFAKDHENWTMSPLQAETTISDWLTARGFTPRPS
jgi:hypothetical protein